MKKLLITILGVVMVFTGCGPSSQQNNVIVAEETPLVETTVEETTIDDYDDWNLYDLDEPLISQKFSGIKFNIFEYKKIKKRKNKRTYIIDNYNQIIVSWEKDSEDSLAGAYQGDIISGLEDGGYEIDDSQQYPMDEAKDVALVIDGYYGDNYVATALFVHNKKRYSFMYISEDEEDDYEPLLSILDTVQYSKFREGK